MIPGCAIAHSNECALRLDAANDGHSGYTIYLRLTKMAGAMINPPGETCYSFDMSRGSLCDLFGRAWHPTNPDYDPGPPPPPKPPKEKKEQKVGGGVEKPPVVTKQAQRPRGYQQHDEVVPGSSPGQTSRRQRPTGDRTEGSGGRGRGHASPGFVRQPRGKGRGRGGGSRIGTSDR